MDLKQILKANRPSLSEKTVYSYCSTLSSLYKKIFNSNDIEPEKFNTDYEKVIAELELKPPASRRTTYGILYVLTNNDVYKNNMLQDIQEYNNENEKQEMSEKQQEAFKSQDDIKAKLQELKTNADLIYKKGRKSAKDLQDIQLYILLCLTSGVYIPPRRSLDWCEFKILKIDEKSNYIDKNTFVFNTYKGSSKKGVQKISIPKELHTILKKWIAINENEYLLFDVNGNKLSAVKLNQRMNKIFDGKSSVNTMRHSFLSTNFQQTIEDNKKMEQVMKDMGSSTSQQNIYIQKL